ncbi:hypothetical protein [Variovorax saccharolyticus]|uniref:hypothetical protein n=1 Tax=Variovorax saccharolyticus TaxID=3053516 RepID=UPI0025759037|nr:hypothetical protein [Variovorax sp. J31P216]MDM0030190.1 hypothetical protein [Variovorax sp. J31P216]
MVLPLRAARQHQGAEGDCEAMSHLFEDAEANEARFWQPNPQSGCGLNPERAMPPVLHRPDISPHQQFPSKSLVMAHNAYRSDIGQPDPGAPLTRCWGDVPIYESPPNETLVMASHVRPSRPLGILSNGKDLGRLLDAAEHNPMTHPARNELITAKVHSAVANKNVTLVQYALIENRPRLLTRLSKLKGLDGVSVAEEIRKGSSRKPSILHDAVIGENPALLRAFCKGSMKSQQDKELLLAAMGKTNEKRETIFDLAVRRPNPELVETLFGVLKSAGISQDRMASFIIGTDLVNKAVRLGRAAHVEALIDVLGILDQTEENVVRFSSTFRHAMKCSSPAVVTALIRSLQRGQMDIKKVLGYDPIEVALKAGDRPENIRALFQGLNEIGLQDRVQGLVIDGLPYAYYLSGNESIRLDPETVQVMFETLEKTDDNSKRGSLMDKLMRRQLLPNVCSNPEMIQDFMRHMVHAGLGQVLSKLMEERDVKGLSVVDRMLTDRAAVHFFCGIKEAGLASEDFIKAIQDKFLQLFEEGRHPEEAHIRRAFISLNALGISKKSWRELLLTRNSSGDTPLCHLLSRNHYPKSLHLTEFFTGLQIADMEDDAFVSEMMSERKPGSDALYLEPRNGSESFRNKLFKEIEKAWRPEQFECSSDRPYKIVNFLANNDEAELPFAFGTQVIRAPLAADYIVWHLDHSGALYPKSFLQNLAGKNPLHEVLEKDILRYKPKLLGKFMKFNMDREIRRAVAALYESNGLEKFSQQKSKDIYETLHSAQKGFFGNSAAYNKFKSRPNSGYHGFKMLKTILKNQGNAMT